MHRGIREAFSGPLPPVRSLGEQMHKYLKRLTDKNDVNCLQETHGNDEFLQAFQVLHTPFRMFGTFINDNVNAGGSAILICKNLLPEPCGCHARDHLPGA